MVPDVWLVPMFNAVVVPENVTAPVALRVAPWTKVVAMTLPPLTLPVADIRPTVVTLPPCMLPATLNADPPVLAMATVVAVLKVTVAAAVVAVTGPIAMVVVEPARPPRPMLIVLVEPDAVAPPWIFVV